MIRIYFETRLHSSRMRTARALTVSPSMLCAGGVPGPGGGAGPGCVPGLGRVPGLGCLLGGIPACTEADLPL